MNTTNNNSDDDQAPPIDVQQMHQWLTTGGGANLTGPPTGDAPPQQLPPPGAPRSVMRNTRVPWEADQAVQAHAAAAGITVSEWIRQAILAHLAGEHPTPGDPVIELRLTLAAATRALDRIEHSHAA